MMENLLFSLNNVGAIWLNPSSTTWAVDMILAFVCGLGLFLLLLPSLQGYLTSVPPGKNKIRKHQMEKRMRSKKKMKNGILKSSRDCLKNVDDNQNMALFLQSHLEKLCDKGGFQQLLHEDAPGEMFKQGPDGAYQSPSQHVEDPSPTTLSPLASLAPLTKHSLPLASSLPEEHKEDQFDLNRGPLATVSQSSLVSNSYWSSFTTAISGLDWISYSILFFSWWWQTAKALFFSTWIHGKSQKEHLSHHPPDPIIWGNPIHRKVEVGGLSFINPNVQKLLEMLITKRVELKMWRENAKDGSSFNKMSPDCTLNSLRKMLKSLQDKQDTATHPFWNTKGKPEQLHGSRHFSYPKTLGDSVEQKYIQFWGLPSLHSESLVAAAWVSKASSLGEHKFVTFNKVVDFSTFQQQNEQPPQLSQEGHLAQEEAQSQLSEQNLPPSVAPIKNIPCYFPNLPRPSPSQSSSETCRTTCTKCNDEAQSSIPNEDQQLEWPLKSRLKWKKILLSELQKSGEANNQTTLNLPQGSWDSQISQIASIFTGDSNSQELQNKPKQHSEGRWFRDKHQLGAPHRFPASQEQMQPQGKFIVKCQCQRKDKQGPFHFIQSSSLAGESSKAVQNMESKSSEKNYPIKFEVDDTINSLDLESEPVDLSLRSSSTSVNVQKDNKKDSGIIPRRPRKAVLQRDLYMSPNKKILEKILQAHLGRKLAQINEGMIPVCVRGSWLATNYAFPKSYTPPKTINCASSKNQPVYVNTSKKLSFLDPGVHLMLESDIMRSRVRRRWNSDLQAFGPMTHNLGESQASSLPQPALPSSAFYDPRANSITNVANFLEELPQKDPRETVIRKMSLRPLKTSLPAPSPSEVQRTWRETSLGGSQGPSVSPPSEQQHRMPFQPHPQSLLSRIQQSKVIVGVGKENLEPSPSLSMVVYVPQEENKDVASGDSSCGEGMLDIKVGTQPSRAEGTKETEVEKESPPEWKLTVGACVMANYLQAINVNLRSLGSPENMKSPCPSRNSFNQDPGDSDLKAQVGSGVQLKEALESGKQPQDQVTGILQDGHNDGLPTLGILPSQASLSNSQSKVSTSQGPCDVLMKRGSSQAQGKLKVINIEVSGRKENTMLCSNDKREDGGRPRSREEEDSSQDCGLKTLVKVKETETSWSKTSPCLSEQVEAPPGGYIKNRMKYFLQVFNSHKKGKGQEDSLQKGKLLSATSQIQRSVTNHLFKNTGPVETQALMALVGQILMEKLGLLPGSGTPDFNEHKERLQGQRRRQVYHHRGSSYPERKKVMRENATVHQVNCKGYSLPIKNNWIGDKDSNQTLKPRVPESPASPCQHKPMGAHYSGHLYHYPTCLLQNTPLHDQQHHATPFIPRRKVFFQKKINT